MHGQNHIKPLFNVYVMELLMMGIVVPETC